MGAGTDTITHTITHTEVLVVGAGPTGLALAVDLARRGVDALVVERADALFPGSRGKGIQPRTREVFHDLGVLDAIHAVGGPYPVGMIWQDGTRVGEHRMFDPAEASDDSPYTDPWMVPQWRTQQILFERLTELGGRVEFGRELVAVEQDADTVTAHFAAGDPVRARYAVAADGGRSAVRRALGIGMTGETVDPHPMLVADVRITGLDRDNWHVFPPREGSDGFLAICPLALHRGLPGDRAVPRGNRARPLPRRHPQGGRRALPPGPRGRDRSPLGLGLPAPGRAGRPLPRGARPPGRGRRARPLTAGGQGLNTSVQDAYNLGWKLGAVLRDNVPDTLVETYEEERRPVAAHMLGISTGVHRGEIRRGEATRQLGLGYRESSLAVDTRAAAGPVRAGDRAPDTTADGVRLFDIFRGPHWTLLTVGTDAGLPELAVPTARIPACEAYGTGVYLVRPDGYVGWAGDTADGLAQYARRMGLQAREL